MYVRNVCMLCMYDMYGMRARYACALSVSVCVCVYVVYVYPYRKYGMSPRYARMCVARGVYACMLCVYVM